jgi:uncharacterized protein (TIGR00725 family)
VTEARGPYVAVVGGGDAVRPDLDRAEEVGRLLARAGAVLVCGGLGGVMHAAARGCESEGGISIGILPGDDRAPASAHLTVAIATGLGETRNAVIARAVDAMIAVAGEFGTLSEIALALRMGKPVVGLDTWRLSRRGRRVDAVLEAADAADAVSLALHHAAGRV